MTDPLTELHPLTPPVAIAMGDDVSHRLPNDEEYAWIVEACALPYLRTGEGPAVFANRCMAELTEAGFTDIQVLDTKNVVSVWAYYQGHPYIFTRGSEVKFKGKKDLSDMALDWFRNFQAMGWCSHGPAKIHRGIYKESGLLTEAGLPEQWIHDYEPRFIGHSKAAGISSVRSVLEPKKRCFVFTLGGMRCFKRGWQINPWVRPDWVDDYNKRVVTWRIAHPADPVPSTPLVVRAFHTGSCVVVNDDKSREWRTEKQMAYDRLQWVGENFVDLAFSGPMGKIGQAVRWGKIIYRAWKGVFPKHMMTSYRALKADANMGAQRARETT